MLPQSTMEYTSKVLLLFTMLLATTSVKVDHVNYTEIFDPVICGPENNFWNSCFAEQVGGYDPEKECTPTPQPTSAPSDDRPIYLRQCGLLLEPVICGPEDDYFSNSCYVEVEGGYDPD